MIREDDPERRAHPIRLVCLLRNSTQRGQRDHRGAFEDISTPGNLSRARGSRPRQRIPFTVGFRSELEAPERT